MLPKSAKAKGKLLEKWVSEQLRYSGIDKQARPEIGSGSGKFKGDISTKLPLTIECKNTKNFQSKKFIAQAEKASMGYQESIVVWHPPQTKMDSSKVMISWQFFMILIKSFFSNNN